MVWCNWVRTSRSIFDLAWKQLMLFEHMLPTAYLDIRRGLGQGSGLDSPGYNRINEVAPIVWSSFVRCMERNHVELLAVFAQPCIGVSRNHFNAQDVELHIVTGQLNHFRVNLDRCDFNVR